MKPFSLFLEGASDLMTNLRVVPFWNAILGFNFTIGTKDVITL